MREHVPDYEVELAIVIGKAAKNVSEADALDYVLGYTGANDVRELFFSWRRAKLGRKVSFRKHQMAVSQWSFSKSFGIPKFKSGCVNELTRMKIDNTNPFGPCIVSASAIPDPQKIPLKSTVNGVVLQDGNTSYVLFLYCVDSYS